jgi:AraC-like DNA-binding protein
MSKLRQSALLRKPADSRSQITSHSRDYPAQHRIPTQSHDRDQLVYAARGVMAVSTSDSTWIVPPQRAVWIPARKPHRIVMSGVVAMRTLYLRPGTAKTLRLECCVVNVPPLLQNLILHACELKSLSRGSRRERHVIDIIVDQLEAIQTVPLRLPNPSDARAQRVAQLLHAAPGSQRRLDHFCRLAGASKRNMERLFLKDVGMSLGRWRQQSRLMCALQLLAQGATVTNAALESGYSTPSSFISMFRKVLNTTPARYFSTGMPAG